MKKTMQKKSILLCLITSLTLVVCGSVGLHKSIDASASADFSNVAGASVRVSTPNGIRYRVALTEAKKAEVFAADSNKTLGMFIFPADKAEAYADNYAALAQKVNVTFTEDDLYEEGGLWCANGVMSNVYTQNFNRDFVGVGYIATQNGDDVTYEYSAYTLGDVARSMADVAIGTYGSDNVSSSMKAAMLPLIEQAMYADYGVVESRTVEGDSFTSTWDMDEVTYNTWAELTAANPVSISSGVAENAIQIDVEQTATLNAAMVINKKEVALDIPFTYVSADKDVVSVDESGKLTALSAGETTVTVSFANYSVDVVVNAVVPTMYNVTVNGGEGSGEYREGSTATITATVPSGKAFVKWTGVNGEEVSTEATYSFTVNSDITYTAEFRDLVEIVREITSLSDFTADSQTVYNKTDPGNFASYVQEDNTFFFCNGSGLSTGALTGTFTEFTMDFTMSRSSNGGMDNFYWIINGAKFFYCDQWRIGTLLTADEVADDAVSNGEANWIVVKNEGESESTLVTDFRIVVNATSISLYAKQGANDYRLLRTIEQQAAETTISYSLYCHAHKLSNMKITYMG